MTGPDTPRERLAAAAVAGEWLDLLPGRGAGDDGVLDEAVMRGWGTDHDLPADDLVAVLRGHGLPDGAAPHPRGVRVRGARILGRIDLDFVTDAVPLMLADCLLDHGVSAYAAHLPFIELRRCRITHPTAIPLVASGAQIADDLRLDDSVITAAVSGSWAAVKLTGAHLGGDLSCFRSTLVSESGTALDANRCQVGGDVLLADGFSARGGGEFGAVRLVGARITGQLSARGAELINESGSALHADRCEVGGSVFLDRGFSARGGGEFGAVRLVGARITGQLGARGGAMINDSGAALIADGCQVGGDVFLHEGFSGRGAGESGAVRLAGARITGQLGARGGAMINDSGAALIADGCQVGGDVFLDDGFSARGGGELAAVRLDGARIAGQLSARKAKLSSATTSALELEQARVDGPLLLDDGFAASGAGSQPVIDLTGAHLGGLYVNGAVTHAADPQRRWSLDGCTYTGLPCPDDRDWWLTLLRDATPGYAAQPYQHLAAAHRNAGHDRDVREILIAQRDDQIRRGRMTARDRAWARFTGILLGYGWKPWRALYGLAAVLVVSIGLAVVLGQHGALAHPARTTPPSSSATTSVPAAMAGAGAPCSIVERVGVGLDLGTPLLGTATRARDRCLIATDPATGTTGATATALTITTWVLQAIAWALAALFVAGFTSAVRKT